MIALAADYIDFMINKPVFQTFCSVIVVLYLPVTSSFAWGSITFCRISLYVKRSIISFILWIGPTLVPQRRTQNKTFSRLYFTEILVQWRLNWFSFGRRTRSNAEHVFYCVVIQFNFYPTILAYGILIIFNGRIRLQLMNICFVSAVIVIFMKKKKNKVELLSISSYLKNYFCTLWNQVML